MTKAKQLGLTLKPEHYEQVKTRADKEYVNISTWIRQTILKELETNQEVTNNDMDNKQN